MTRKDYKAIARILAAQSDNIRKDDLIERLCLLFGHDTPRFDEWKFRTACYAK